MSPRSLEEVFNKDPWTLSDAEVDTIVGALQADRARWAQTPEGKGEKKTKKIEAPADLKIEDLEI